MAAVTRGSSALTEQLAELRAGWHVVLAGAVLVAISMPTIGTYSLTFFIAGWQREFGWTREASGVAASCLTITIFLTAPLVGRICDRIGVRAVASVSIPFFAFSLFLLSRLSGDISRLYLGYSALAVLGAGAGHVCYLRTVASWFDKARGLALGIAGSGAGFAAALAPQLLAPVIDIYGWRAGWLALSAASLLGLPLVLLFMAERKPPRESRTNVDMGMTGAEARRSLVFWLLLSGTVALGIGLVGMTVQIVPLVKELSGSAHLASTAATALGISILVSRLCTGFLLDRYPPHIIAGVIAASPAIGIAMFVWDPTMSALALGISLGIAGGAEHDIISFMVARAFGMRAFSEIFGSIFAALSFGAAIGPLLVRGMHYLQFGPNAPLFISAVLCLTAGMLYVALGRAVTSLLYLG